MTYVVRVLKSAESDIADAMTWYRIQQEGLDVAFLGAVDDALARIAVSPMSFRTRIRDHRAVLLRRFPYTLYYRIIADEVRVAAVLHHRRGPHALADRLPARSSKF